MHLLISETDSCFYYCHQQFFSTKALLFKASSHKILKIDTKHLHSLKLYLFDASTCILTAWHNQYISREILDRCKDSSYLIKEEWIIISIVYWQHVKFFLQANFDHI